MSFLPGENAEYEIEHEKRPHHDQGNEEDPVEGTADGIVCLEKRREEKTKCKSKNLKCSIFMFSSFG